MTDMSPTVELVLRTLASAQGVGDLDEPVKEPFDPSSVCGVRRDAAVMLVVIAAIDELGNRGYVNGPARMTASGAEKHIEIIQSGFVPTDWEIVSVTRYLIGGDA